MNLSLLFLRRGALWRLRGATTQRLLAVPYSRHHWLALTADRSGRRSAIEGEGGLWVVHARPGAGARPRWYPGLGDARFAPDGRRFAATRGGEEGVVQIDTATGRRRVLRVTGSQPFWSGDGSEIALIEGEIDDRRPVVLDANSGQVRLALRKSILNTWPILSPTGRYLAVGNRLSRPKMGHQIFDRRTRAWRERSLDYPNRLPAVIWDFSPDETRVAVNWRLPDPDNDGTWRGDEVGLVSLAPGVVRWIGSGYHASFTPDGRRLLFLRSRQALSRAYPRDLMTCSVRGGEPKVLLRDVDAFAVIVDTIGA